MLFPRHFSTVCKQLYRGVCQSNYVNKLLVMNSLGNIHLPIKLMRKIKFVSCHNLCILYILSQEKTSQEKICINAQRHFFL